jgi:hypothetical protein
VGMQSGGEVMYAYNPRKKSSDELAQSLVGDDRWDILNGILSELALKKGESPKQHWMLVGARGMGKSHLLTLLHHKVCADKKLSKLWIPVLFPEEIRMAGDLAKFLERAISEVQRDLEKEKSPIAADLKEKIAKIRTVRHDERVEYLFSLITWIRRETNRHILLIAENLQQLLGKKICLIDQKKLRAFLQSEDALLLIGSATTIFTALHDHSHPFYHFFHIRRLQELSFGDIKTLVGNLLNGHDKKERTRIMTESEARLRVIHSFTGGNPRMAVFLSDILKTDINEEMIQIMDRILDELTPYFEAIINDTPEYLHDIINTLAAFEPAQSPKEIAEHLEMEQGTVRNYMKQAKESGYVRVAFSRGKSNYYCLNEYLYRTWFQMRDSSHREEMRWLIELMMFLYSREHISAERDRIEHLGIKDENNYHQLVKQTYDFMITNPAFYTVIDLCVQQTKVNKTTTKEMVGQLINSRTKKVLKDMKIKLKTLEKKGIKSKREYMKKATQIYVDVLANVDKGPVGLLVSYATAIPMYFRITYDISGTLKDYREKIIELQTKHQDKLIDSINVVPNGEMDEMLLLLNVALGRYDAALKFAHNITDRAENKTVIAAIDLLLIQIVYYASTNDYFKMFKAYDAFYEVCQTLNIQNVEFRLYIILIISNALRLISEESINKLIEHTASMSNTSLVAERLWACFKEPESESAKKFMSEPPIANLVNKMKGIVAEAKKQENQLDV